MQIDAEHRPDDDELLTTAEAAALLNVGKSTLERDRLKPKPMIPVVQLAPRIVRYRRGTLRAVARAREHGAKATSEGAPRSHAGSLGAA